MIYDDYNGFVACCEAYTEREFSVWVDTDADFEEPIPDEETKGG